MGPPAYAALGQSVDEQLLSGAEWDIRGVQGEDDSNEMLLSVLPPPPQYESITFA